jgi:hypothetical protein
MLTKASKLAQVVVLALMVAATFTSINQLNTNAEFCGGHSCSTSNDCGTSCFCNTKNATCYYLELGPSH